MYWCNKRKHNTLLLTIFFFTGLNGCKPEVKQGNGSLKYFDLKKYFTAEALRLTKQHVVVLKTASYNGQQQTKPTPIKDWNRELALFTESDINKASWKDSYTAKANADSIVYTAIDTTLHTRRILIGLSNNKVRCIQINNFTKNMLYQTGEQLAYYPDSLYSIKKQQAIVLLGTNKYTITGKFK